MLSFVTLTSAKTPDIELAIRYIKLGNTYREGKDFDKSAKFISDGLKELKKLKGFDANYWTAVAFENLGYLYRDMAMYDESKINFQKAIDIYNKIIWQEDGSQHALVSVLNRISEINKTEIVQNKAVAGLSGNSVVLAGKKLKDLPPDLPSNAKSLILRDNRFRIFPEGIMQHKMLEYLDLSKNRLRAISDNIGSLKQLHYLDLSGNRIEKLPSSISGLENLTELNLSNNKLRDVNFNICNLKNLKLLNLQNNRINFQDVLKLVKCLPNTNILFDKYQRIDDSTSTDDFDDYN